MKVDINVDGKMVAKKTAQCGIEIILGVGCEVAIHFISKALIKKIEEKMASKCSYELEDDLDDDILFDEPGDKWEDRLD